jgi:hypothetical protein
MPVTVEYRRRTDPVASEQHTGARSLRRMQTLLDTWQEAGLVDVDTRFERVDLAGGPAAVISRRGRPARLLPLGGWLYLAADGVVRVTSSGRPPRAERIRAIQHRGRASLDEMDTLVDGWLCGRAIDGQTALARTDYRGQPAVLVTDSRRRGQLLLPTAWLVHSEDPYLRVLRSDRFDAEFAVLESRPAEVTP